ncbi:MAG: hypothetical protein Unbinned1322contig1000_3 [Prokaryotic dsDNA virus sp.]|nr:MAG: hypothetical protein Unbinned1322contig1000_3 [Prokaryotic dsDNA virus sp.]
MATLKHYRLRTMHQLATMASTVTKTGKNFQEAKAQATYFSIHLAQHTDNLAAYNEVMQFTIDVSNAASLLDCFNLKSTLEEMNL